MTGNTAVQSKPADPQAHNAGPLLPKANQYREAVFVHDAPLDPEQPAQPSMARAIADVLQSENDDLRARLDALERRQDRTDNLPTDSYVDEERGLKFTSRGHGNVTVETVVKQFTGKTGVEPVPGTWVDDCGSVRRHRDGKPYIPPITMAQANARRTRAGQDIVDKNQADYDQLKKRAHDLIVELNKTLPLPKRINADGVILCHDNIIRTTAK
jgi:hypothetical protein